MNFIEYFNKETCCGKTFKNGLPYCTMYSRVARFVTVWFPSYKSAISLRITSFTHSSYNKKNNN